MAFPAYQALRAHFPDAHLSLLCTENVADLDFAETLHWDEKRVLSVEQRKFPSGLLSLAADLRRERYDLAVSFPHSFSAAFLFQASGIPERIGFSGDWNRAFFTQSLRWRGPESGRHKSLLYRELIDLVTGNSSALNASHSEEKSGLENRKKEPSEPSYLVIAPGASLPLREWPYTAELLMGLRKEYPHLRLRVVASPQEKKWSSLVGRLGDPAIEDWVGKTTLPSLITLCRGARLVIANDSGVAHLSASLAEAPTLVLFGPGNPTYVAPRGPQVRVARVEGLACSPCEKPYCRAPYGYQRCLRDLSLSQVLSEIRMLL